MTATHLLFHYFLNHCLDETATLLDPSSESQTAVRGDEEVSPGRTNRDLYALALFPELPSAISDPQGLVDLNFPIISDHRARPIAQNA